MYKYILKRLLFLLPMMIIVSFIAFYLIDASSSSPGRIILEAQGVPEITQTLIEETNHKYGFDEPFVVRYFLWMKKAAQLDFGKSFVSNENVSTLILTSFFYTLKLTIATAVTIILFSVSLSVVCVFLKNKFVDKIIRSGMFFLAATPPYLIGIILIWLFSVKFNSLPTSGVGDFSHYILPVLANTIGYASFFFRMLRNSMLENIHENYVYFYRSSGVSEKKIIKHIIKNSLQTAVTAFSMAIPALIAGTAVIENIFAWPGIGRLCVAAIFNRDIPIIQAYVLLIGLFYCVFNILADIINAWINPKLREA
ncbi:nickel transport system permease protein [Peptostreptococcaceae bacterium pGA-8]|nr:nickel transport system permease protein [Peptostreptococcaceae bacterium pGA-8]